MLRYEAGGGHARGGVSLKNVRHAVFCNYIVNAHNALAAHKRVVLLGELLNLSGLFWRYAGGRNLLNLTVIFGIVVKELISANHLCKREHHCLVLGLVHAAGKLSAL